MSGMSIEWRDYGIRIWQGHDDWVDVFCSGLLQYSRNNQGCGMQMNADEGTSEYQHVMALCDNVRSEILDLDKYLRGVEGERA